MATMPIYAAALLNSALAGSGFRSGKRTIKDNDGEIKTGY